MLRVERIQPIYPTRNSLYRDPRFNYTGQNQQKQSGEQQKPKQDSFESTLEEKLQEVQQEEPVKRLTLTRTPPKRYSGFDMYV